ncbi:MAG: hypothetical protein QOE30_5002 [Mycobacterium sp.]|uniref:hypothetical protein n=1 Tax=Mycobacterium sp. TaxID=1785 RepID=UPI0028B7E144|nr:hypothetical protein [Mycobacterium sp.]MDT5119263.1 hypothetical protein [Mycobacterium sp.]
MSDERWTEPDWETLDRRRSELQIRLRVEHPDWSYQQTLNAALRSIVMDGKDLVCYDEMLDNLKGIKLIDGIRLNRAAGQLEGALTAQPDVPWDLANQVRLAIREMRELA